MNKLAQHLTTYGKEHWAAALKVLKYLNSTKDLGLTIKKGSPEIEVYVDASYAMEYDRRSRTGLIILINGCPVIWESTKQKAMTLSSAEAEYVALASALRQTMWLKSIMKQLFDMEKRITIYIDNLPAKLVAENLDGSKLTKHIDIKYHYVKEIVNNPDNKIDLVYLESGNMTADLLTKPLGPINFKKHRDVLMNKVE